MKKKQIILTILILNLNLCFAQTKYEIDFLLNKISETENSKSIVKIEETKQIMNFGKKILPILAEFFTDTIQTKVFSECQNRYLKKGEIAIIIADRIERMPYFTLTRIQNCILSFCENNPNWIEYYLWAINENGMELFKKNYIIWLKYAKRKNFSLLKYSLKENKKNKQKTRK